MTRGPTIAGPNLHGPAEHQVLDLNHDGHVTARELLLAVAIGSGVLALATAVGAVLVRAFCG